MTFNDINETNNNILRIDCVKKIEKYMFNYLII